MTTIDFVRAYCDAHEEIGAILGKDDDAKKWKIQEIGDGNINFVFKVTSREASVCFKRAMPFIRVVKTAGLSPERLKYEGMYLKEASRICKARVPSIVRCDPDRGVLVMEWLSPHVILRGGLLHGRLFSASFPKQTGEFLARMFFATSELGAARAERRRLLEAYAGNNAEMRSLTADVIFTTPFQRKPTEAFPNNYLKPYLNDAVRAIQSDVALKRCVVSLRHKFLTSNEALLHGDLHTGSIMVDDKSGDTKIIDAEFSQLGPMGFDLGLVMAHIFLAAFSLRGRRATTAQGSLVEETKRTLGLVRNVWGAFRDTLDGLWRDASQGSSEYSKIFESEEERCSVREHFFQRLFLESCGYAGVAMLRRVIGVVSTEDLTSIADSRARAACEVDICRFARMLVLESGGVRATKRPLDLASLTSRAEAVLVGKSATPFDDVSNDAAVRVPWRLPGQMTVAAAVRKLNVLRSRYVGPESVYAKKRGPDRFPRGEGGKDVPHIYVGSGANARDVETLTKLNIGAVLNCASSVCKDPADVYKKRNISYLALDLRDVAGFKIMDEGLKRASDFIGKAHDAGRNVLVHCFAGVNRSATLAVAYLLVRDRQPLLELFQDCIAARTSIISNKSFQRQLCELAAKYALLPEKFETKDPKTVVDRAGSSSAASTKTTAPPNFVELRGDLLAAKEKFIVHQTNCRTDYALGLAKHIFKRWPHADCYSERKPWVKGKVYSKPGSIVVRGGENDGGKRGVINLMGQDMPGKIEKQLSTRQKGQSKLDASKQQRQAWFASALEQMAAMPDLKSVAFPYEIGCGLAAGDWGAYRDLIRGLAEKRHDVSVKIYRLPDAKAIAFKKEVAHDKKHSKKAKARYQQSLEAAFGRSSGKKHEKDPKRRGEGGGRTSK